jgi:hypothetical protein
MDGMQGLDYLRNNAREFGNTRTFRADSFMLTVDAAEAFARGVAEGTVPLHARSNVDTIQRMWNNSQDNDTWRFGDYESLSGWRSAMLAGDAAGAERVAQFASDIAPALAAPISARRRLSRGAQGDEVCPHAILRGDLPRAWTARRRAMGRAPAPVAILVPMSGNAHVHAESFRWRAAAALALAGPLTRAGYRATILAADAVSGTYTASGAPVRSFVFHRVAGGANLDIPRVSAAISAPHLRFVTFAILCAAPYEVHGGLGHAIPAGEVYVAAALAAGVIRPGEDVLTVPPAMCDAKAARAWVAETSKRYAPQGA